MLGGLRDRYDDVDAPMSLEDMQEALDEIEHARPKRASIETNVQQKTEMASSLQVSPDFN